MNPGPERWTELARRFDLGQVRGAAQFVARGAMGEVWRLETIRGAWAVKWRFPWGPVQPRPADVGVQLAAAAAGIPLPVPVLTPAGEAVARIGSRHVRVYEWAELARPAEPPVSDRTAAEAGCCWACCTAWHCRQRSRTIPGTRRFGRRRTGPRSRTVPRRPE